MDAPHLLTSNPGALPDFPLEPDFPLGQEFLARGIADYQDTTRHVMLLPYGRNTDRSDYLFVLKEGRGTCSTKHALLSALAKEHNQPVGLCLGIYEMDGDNTPGIGPVLKRHDLDSIPEAHCYLMYRGVRVDLTGAGEAWQPIRAFLYEEKIEPHEIGAYKVDLHMEFVRQWAHARNLESNAVWRAREECIQALSARDGV